MCFEYVGTCDSYLCIVALRIIMLLQTAFGPWHRLEKRELKYNADSYKIGAGETQRATEMKKWCVNTSNKMVGEGGATYALVGLKGGSHAGGLLFAGLRRPEYR